MLWLEHDVKCQKKMKYAMIKRILITEDDSYIMIYSNQIKQKVT